MFLGLTAAIASLMRPSPREMKLSSKAFNSFFVQRLTRSLAGVACKPAQLEDCHSADDLVAYGAMRWEVTPGHKQSLNGATELFGVRERPSSPQPTFCSSRSAIYILESEYAVLIPWGLQKGRLVGRKPQPLRLTSSSLSFAK